MSYLVRKIARGKWPNQVIIKDDFDGDTISDLKTTKNTLSLWRINSEEELDAAILALSASSKSEFIEAIDIVWIPESVLTSASMNISNDQGDTIIKDLQEKHCNITDITYKTLGDIAEIITKEMISNGHYRKITCPNVKKALAKAYKDKRIVEEKCTPQMLERIKQAYDKYKDEM